MKLSKPPPEIRIVSVPHHATYAFAIRVKAGDPILVTGREESWDGHRWLWVEANGREGWAPDDLPLDTAAGPVAAYDYDAMELTVAAGESVVLLKERHGWYWCLNDQGDEGWVPARRLAPPR